MLLSISEMLSSSTQRPSHSVNRIVTKRQHPEPLRSFLPEIEAFARYNHEHVLHPILR